MTTTTSRQRQAATQTAKAAAINAALVEEIEFLLACDVGEASLLEALGYTRNPAALKRRLMRLNRHDLNTRIFEADQLYHDRHTNMGIGTATARKASR